MSGRYDEQSFNPAYRIARCGASSSHGPHVMEHGPDQPRNCPGTGRRTIEVRSDGGHDPCIGGGSSRDCERGECNARAMCAAAALIPRDDTGQADPGCVWPDGVCTCGEPAGHQHPRDDT